MQQKSFEHLLTLTDKKEIESQFPGFWESVEKDSFRVAYSILYLFRDVDDYASLLFSITANEILEVLVDESEQEGKHQVIQEFLTFVQKLIKEQFEVTDSDTSFDEQIQNFIISTLLQPFLKTVKDYALNSLAKKPRWETDLVYTDEIIDSDLFQKLFSKLAPEVEKFFEQKRDQWYKDYVQDRERVLAGRFEDTILQSIMAAFIDKEEDLFVPSMEAIAAVFEDYYSDDIRPEPESNSHKDRLTFFYTNNSQFFLWHLLEVMKKEGKLV
jgi:hypothetical protein